MDAALEQLAPLGLALGLGLLVGLQREWVASDIAGIRTFPLITMFGAMCGLLAEPLGVWVVSAGLIGVLGLFVIGNVLKVRAGRIDPGMTTEAAGLVMFIVGSALSAGFTAPAVATTGVVAVLLHWKKPLHKMVSRIDKRDFRAIIQFVIIALVILPVLPNETYGPYDVLNPHQIWLMVALIVGISLGAYVAYKLLGARVGSVLGGVFGGLISSTATTVSYARQTKDDTSLAPMAAMVIMIATCIVNVRVVIEMGIVSPSFLRSEWVPFAILFGVMATLSVLMFFIAGRKKSDGYEPENPAQLKSALIFGGLYAVVLFAVAAAKENFGREAMYIVAALSGLTDLDAITLSTSRLVSEGRVEPDTGWRVIVVGMMSNLVFKAGAVAVLGSRTLLIYMAALLGISIVAGGVVLSLG